MSFADSSTGSSTSNVAKETGGNLATLVALDTKILAAVEFLGIVLQNLLIEVKMQNEMLVIGLTLVKQFPDLDTLRKEIAILVPSEFERTQE